MNKKNTTLVNQESTSSDEMADSKPWTAVVRLGERIVDEFGLSNSVDTLGRWMAHRIAELMDRAERAAPGTESESARHECSDLIIRLWERRSHWPHGRPLADVAGLLKNLINGETNYGSRYERHEIEIDARSWIGILPRLRQLQDREQDLCRNAAIADFDLEADRKWLVEHGTDLSNEEREIIEGLIRERERMDEPYFELDKTRHPNFTSLTSAERARLVHQGLAKINEERQHLFSSVQVEGERLGNRKNVEPSASSLDRARGKSKTREPGAAKKGAAKKGASKRSGSNKPARKKTKRR